MFLEKSIDKAYICKHEIYKLTLKNLFTCNVCFSETHIIPTLVKQLSTIARHPMLQDILFYIYIYIYFILGTKLSPSLE